MGSNRSGKKPTMTIETEYGYFIRRKTRRGKKRTQKTERLKKQSQKVVIDRIGELEIYVYPYDYPEKVFLGIYPLSTVIGEEDFKRFFGILNKIRWYFNDEWVKDRKREKGVKSLRQRIVNSYNMGLEEMKKRKMNP